MMIRVQAPDGLTSFSHQGHRIDLDGDGIAMIDERHFGDFASHGFREAQDEVPSPAPVRSSIVLPAALAVDEGSADPRRTAAMRRLLALPIGIIEEVLAMTADELRAALQRNAAPEATTVEVAAAPASVEPEPASVPELPSPAVPVQDRLTDEQIDSMTKTAMTAWLKARDVPVATSSDLDTLRAKVRHANGG